MTKVKRLAPERLSGNLAYLDGQINKSNKVFEKKYNSLYDKVDPIGVDGNPIKELIPGQFKLNCSRKEINSLTGEVRSELGYINQCIDELDEIINDFPKNAEYTDAEIQDFINKASAVNSKRYSNIVNPSNNKLSRTGNDSNLPRKIVDEGRKLKGTPYVWGGYDLNVHKGLDCSGFIMYASKMAGYTIPPSGTRHTTKTLINLGEEVTRDNLQIGDIIFPHKDHVGFYSGNGKFLHAPRTGDVIKEVDIYKFWRARRIFPGVGGDSGSSGGGSSSGAGDYYGPGGGVEWIERTPDPEVTKIIVPSGAENWATLSSYLGVSESSLKKLNPGVKTLYAGTTLYIPTSAVTQARELAIKSKNKAAKYNSYIDELSGNFNDTMLMSSDEERDESTNPGVRNVVEEKTPFQSILENEDWIKTYDLKEFDYKEKARLEIVHNGRTRKIETLISPIAYSETYSNSVNVNQTAGGWFISRHGEAPPQLNINGYMLDTSYAPEKHAFMNEFKNYITDKVNKTTGDYENNAIIKIVMEGVEYQGHITSITFNKDANRPALYSFNMSFVCIYYKNMRDVQNVVNNLKTKTKSSGTSLFMADGIASIISK